MTARRIHPGELLDLADVIAGRRARAGRPRTIELRRAISSAYYAIFHELVGQCTADMVRGGAGTPATEATISRWVAHSDVRQLAEAAAGLRTGALRGVLAPTSGDVTLVADAFVALQDARELADYDDTYDVSRRLALGHVDTARDAVERSQGMVGRGDPSYLLFLRLMIGGVRVAKRR